METSSSVTQSSFDPNAPPQSSPAFSQPPTTQIIPGTTVIGTGTTGDVWSYTVPDITSVIIPSTTELRPPSPSPSNPAPTPLPESSGSYVATQIIITGTTVVGGTETGVPWSYTIPDQTIVTSVFIPATTSQTTTPSQTAAPSESPPLTNPLTSLSDSPTPASPLLPGYTEPVPRPPPDSSHTTLSGGIVAAILVGLLLLMFAIAGCLWLRLRRRRREGGPDFERAKEKDVGVVWGRGWRNDDNGFGAWRQRPNLNQQGSGGSSSDGHAGGVRSEVVAPVGALRGGPAVRFREDPRVTPTPGNGSSELLIERANRGAGHPNCVSFLFRQLVSEKFLFVPIVNSYNTRPNTTTPINANITYPVPARYPQTHGSDKNPYTNIDTRAPSSHSTQRNVNTRTNDDTNHKDPSSNKSPTTKSKRPIPAPSPHVYAPPPGDTPDPSPQASHFTNPFSTRPTSPYNRASSPYSSHTSNHGRKVLLKHSKERINPTVLAFKRHMLPTRGASIRRPKIEQSAPPSSMAAPAPARPGLSTLPSFIRERRFSPGTSRQGSESTSHGEGESVIFSPSPRPAQLPSHAPTRINSPVSRSVPTLVQPRLPTTRDGYLSPPAHGYGTRDRSSQLTSTTRSGGSRDTRSTGRSGGSAMTGRTGDSRHTGRSGDSSRLTSPTRGRVLSQIVESDREPGAGRRINDPPRRRRQGP
ncbi:unnamed protein product [Rhizoctonia solani]|uniref:Uncharacterized protein n=1 Tax=Rhizoctonia solani TaxID=456999 RepID=A0A8H2ZZL7_9AGAM|nr:unnamed protein product [Rhizoctonia solani]